MQVKCPQCGKLTEYNEGNPFRPFCSDRCKLIDLGEWASGKYIVPTEELPTDSDDKQEENTEDQD